MSKKNRKNRQELKEKALQPIVAVRRRAILGLALCLLLLGATITSFRQLNNDPVARLDVLISLVETGMSRFESVVVPLVQERFSEDEAVILLEPFVILRENKENQYRNRQRALEARHAKTVTNEELIFERKFFFESLEEVRKIGHDSAASFQPMWRIMYVHPEFDVHNQIDALILYHELLHAVQDARIKAGMKTQERYDRYAALQRREEGSGNRSRNLYNEAYAYAYEVELLNLLLDGWIKRRVAITATTTMQLGIPVEDVESIIQHLNLHPDQVALVGFLLNVASYYYPEGKVGELHPRYLEYMKTLYPGDEFYYFDEETWTFPPVP